MTEEDVEAILPSKAGELEMNKLTGSKIVVYSLDKIPILFDPSGKGDIVPTVFGLWRSPKLVPTVYLKHPAVSQFVVGGADLMLPGVDLSQGLPQFAKEDLVSISVHGNPCPIAIGSALISSDDAPKRKGGKLIEVMQVIKAAVNLSQSYLG